MFHFGNLPSVFDQLFEILPIPSCEELSDGALGIGDDNTLEHEPVDNIAPVVMLDPCLHLTIFLKFRKHNLRLYIELTGI